MTMNETKPEGELSWEELDGRLAAMCGQILTTILNAAARRAEPALAERIAALGEARLVVHARGEVLQIDLLAPGENGSTDLLLGLTARSEEERPSWVN